MGIVQRQASQNLLVLYMGTALGALNYLVLFPRALGEVGFGVVVVLGSLATIGQQLASLGMPYVLLRYFPLLQKAGGGHQGLLRWVLGWSAAGVGLLLALFFLLRPWLASAYAHQSPLVNGYLPYALPLAALLVGMGLLEALLGSLLRTVFNGFVREVLLRLLTALALVGVVLGWLSFDGFLVLYLALHALAMCLMALELVSSKGIRLEPVVIPKSQKKEMLRYGLFLLASGGMSLVVLQNLDKVMLPGYVSLTQVGYYGIYAFIGLAVQLPAKALLRITRQLVVPAWHAQNWPEVQRLYQRSSLVQFSIACLLFLGVWVNQDNLGAILGMDAAFVAAFPVFIWIGISYVADSAAGLNFILLSTSRHYRWDLYFTLILASSNILLNLLLIPRMGIFGAAISTSVSFMAVNAAKCWVLWRLYGQQPLTRAHGWVLVVAIAAGSAVFGMPDLASNWLDASLRTCVLAILYLGPLLMLKLVPELNRLVQKALERLPLRP